MTFAGGNAGRPECDRHPVLVIVALAVLAVVGIEALRRQTAQEFPPGPNSS